jgi:lysophospholipase L1-like esterase
VTGFGLHQEILYFEDIGAAFDPDILIVAFCQNDFQDTSRPITAKELIPTHQAQPQSTLKRMKVTLFNNWSSYRLLSNVVHGNRFLIEASITLGLKPRLAGYGELDVSLRPALLEYRTQQVQELKEVERQMRKLAELRDRLEFTVIVALIPALQSVDQESFQASLATLEYQASDFDLDKPYLIMEEMAASLGFEVVNPLSDFRARTARGETLYLPLDMHFNPTGHDLFARAIAAHLAARPDSGRSRPPSSTEAR